MNVLLNYLTLCFTFIGQQFTKELAPEEKARRKAAQEKREEEWYRNWEDQFGS